MDFGLPIGILLLVKLSAQSIVYLFYLCRMNNHLYGPGN